MVSPTAQALGSLRNLEELLLPTGDGIRQVARLIVRQCLQLQRLRVLAFVETLDDDSVMEIGEFQRVSSWAKDSIIAELPAASVYENIRLPQCPVPSSLPL